MAQLQAGMTEQEAFDLVKEHNKDPFHLEHATTV